MTYSAQTACAVADISQRRLNYWVATGIVAPSLVYKTPRRVLFLFGFRELVQLRAISALLRAGLTLQKVRSAIQTLARRGAALEAAWLVADGKQAYLAHNSATLEALTGPGSGQLAFSILALAETHREVDARLREIDAKPYIPKEQNGHLTRFSRKHEKSRRASHG